MSLETETLYETTTFKHFDREWSVPTKRHLTHIKKMRDDLRSGFSDYNVLVAETMLGQEQFLALLELDPDEDELNTFVGEIAKAMGIGTAGNSRPSSTSS